MMLVTDYNTPCSDADVCLRGEDMHGQATTFGELIGPYLTDRKKSGDFGRKAFYNTRSACYSFADHVGRRPMRNLSPRNVESWLAALHVGGYAPTTRRNYLSAIRGLFAWAIRRGHCRRNPATEVRGPKEPRRLPRAFTAEQVSAILDACPDERARLIVLFMVQLGLRCIEITRLQVGDIDRRTNTARIVGKGGHERVLPIDPQTLAALDDYLLAHPAPAGPLVRNYTDCQRSLNTATISRMLTRILFDAGVKRAPKDGVNAHAGRHTCLTDMLRNGAHLRDVQAAAGHRFLSTTEVYLPLVVDGLEAAMGGRWYGRSGPTQ